MSVEDIAQLYAPSAVINLWERFEWMIPMNRLNSHGEEANPEFYAPFERLYREMRRRYPRVEGWAKTPREWEERRRLREENIFSKMPTQ